MSEQHLPEKAIDLDDQSHADIRKVNFDYSVILFDRVEKAHNFVLKRLLVMIGLGRLTDGQNINVDITNTVIIMTFNLTGTAKDSSLQIAREILIDEVTKHFEPEDLNRFDEIVIFDPLSHDQLRKVARFQMIDIALRLAQRGVALSVTNAAWDVVVSQSYHRFYGGNPIHPIKRRLAKKIVTRLSQMLIQGKIDDDSIVYVDAVPGVKELSYEVKRKNNNNGGLADAEKSDILMEIPANEMTAILHLLQFTNPFISEIIISNIMILLLRDS
ncbi:chaperone protein ClpB1-like [Zingiber officinale]|uniref:chaperone protein ClpB1-like n=1 Tax=Zingiber officinale TaxID=94328 RepID=UPI001C4C57E2|nr:chaperone protein ClpB1-like [Zingiber officinale]